MRFPACAAAFAILIGCVHNADNDASSPPPAAGAPQVVEAPAPSPAVAVPSGTGVVDITASGFNSAPTGAWVGIGFGLGFLSVGSTPAATAGGGGVPIQFVFNGSPAQRAGLQPGDTLMALDGHPVQSALEARRTLHGLAVGQTVQVTFRRAGAEQHVSITAEAAPTVRVATSSMVIPGIAVTMLADQKKLLQDAMTQVTTACTSVEQYASQHSDDAQAQARAKLCHEETDLTRQELELGLKQLELQQQAPH